MAPIDPDAFNLVTLLLRVAVGAMIIAHGYNHIWGGGKLSGTAGWFESMGLRPGRLHALLASVTELVAGTLLIVGLLTPVGAAGVVGVMVVAWLTAHRTNGFFIFKPGQGWEYVMIVTVVGLTIGTIGPGEWSVDAALDLDLVGWSGLAITAVAGLGGAVALLAVFWRPERSGEG
ncbi:MAG: DoxX family protein [Acidimicrobiia bacterium]|nr:DoxX family protein [Acidimicrobiia bacterium]